MSDDAKKLAWGALAQSAQRYSAQPEAVAAQSLAESAVAWAVAKGYREPRPAAASGGNDPTVPFGRSKGKRVSECDTNDLQWLRGAVSKSLDDPAKANFAQRNREFLDAIEAEIERR
jgi:hypothetical protein